MYICASVHVISIIQSNYMNYTFYKKDITEHGLYEL